MSTKQNEESKQPIKHGGKHLLTREGYNKLYAELEDLKNNKRQEIAERIRQAKAFGDISENAEYDEAKKDQAFIEGRIQQLENILSDCEIIESEDVDVHEVNIGCTVSIVNLNTHENITVTIVGTYEAKPQEDKISNVSPLGRELLGHEAGDVVRVVTPKGDVKYRILKISRG